MGELAVIIVYIIIAGIVGLNRMANQSKNKQEDSDTMEPMEPQSPPPMQRPVAPPPRPRPMESSRPPVQTEPRRKTLKKRAQPQQKPTAPPVVKEEEIDPYQPLRDVMKELFGAEDPVIVDEPPQPKPKKKRRPKAKTKQPAAPAAPELKPAIAATHVSHENYLTRLAKEGVENPLRTAVIYSEILGRPKGMGKVNPFVNR